MPNSKIEQRVDQKKTRYGFLTGTCRKFIEAVRPCKPSAATEKDYRPLIHKVRTAIVLHDGRGRILSSNPPARELLGLSEDQLTGKALIDPDWHFLRDDGSVMPAHEYPVSLVLSSRQPLRGYVVGIHRPDQSDIAWCLANAEPEYNDAGDIVRIFVSFIDITERKRAEEALRQSEAKLGDAARIAHVGYWDRDYIAESITLSDEACRIFGLPLQNRLPKLTEWHSQWLKLIHPDDQPKVARAITEALAGGPPYNVDYRVVRSDGEVRSIHSYAEVKRDGSGRPLRMFGTMIDITERKQTEAALQQAAEEIRKLNLELEQRVIERTAQLAAANKELEAFAYSVSHDLRAPLRHINGFLELLQKRMAGVLDERGRHYMNTISGSANHMGMLIDDLLAFSRMGRNQMAKLTVDLDELTREVIREFEPETANRNILWRISDLPEVKGDRPMLRIVLVNLILNALKFTQPRPQTEIEIGRIQPQKSETVIFVRDNGVGFDMNYVDRLFGVFQRLHRVDEFEGTGIGLAIVSRIITRHGGRVWAEGEVNNGAVFYFSLPHPAAPA